jgi:hypothetical protein
MKKIFMLFGALMIMLNVAKAQDCPFSVKFEVIPATCYNNGKVAYAMTNSSGEVITSAGSFTEVRAYYIEQGDTAKHYSGRYLVNASGNMVYPNGWDTLTVDYGTYTIGVEALCWDGSTFVKKDTQTVLTIPTTYVKPSASSLYVTANTEDGFGRRPSLNCVNTGRVQLKIEDGRFPYTVFVVNHDTGDTLRVDTFDSPQYTGTDLTLYNYKDYYTFDSLPPGDWDFYLVDGCDYGLPRTGQKVEVVDYPLLDYVEVYASSGNMHDSNVVKINAVLDKDYAYYNKLLPDYVEYRFTYDGVPSSDWKPFPPVLNGHRAQLTDTLAFADNYCDIWGKDIKLEYHRKYCNDAVISKTFHLYKPNDNYFVRDSSDIRDSLEEPPYTCDDLYYWHRWYHEIRYKYNDPYDITKNEDDPYYRHHYTHPLTWVYYDTEREEVIKTQVVSNISSESRLYDTEVEAIYGDFSSYTMSNPLNLPIRRTLVDANGCVIYTRFDSLPYCYDHGPEIVDWEMYHTPGDHCCATQGSIGVKEHFHSEVDPDGTIIKLERSPYDNRYNFEAVYSSATQSWTIHRSNFENVATIKGGNDGLSMELRDYCLPSGPYHFRVITPCHEFILKDTIAFPDVYSTKMIEEPQFTSHQQCTDMYITYTQGKFARESRNTSMTDGLPLPVETTELSTYFQIIEGPTGGYDGTLHQVNEPIRISMPGDFVVKVAPSTSLFVCDLPDYYDTIHYGGPTVEFVYAYAFLCDSTSTQGTAYVKGTNGTPPYTYTLFNDIDKQGDTIEVITLSDTTQPAIFSDKAMNSRHEMSCSIEDACGAYFHVNFYPRTIADLQKIWFDGGLQVMETCEGSTISAHALEIASILKYQWYNPNGELIDSVSSPSIFIPRGADDGWYKVIIRNSGCQDSIVDSVKLTVKPSPSITLSQTDTVCPGEPVELHFTPTSATGDDVEFTIAFENGNGIEYRTYTAGSGVSISEEYITLTDAKIYPFSQDDGNCEYNLADAHDTIYIRTKKEIADACTIMGSLDTVCYGSDAHFAARSTMEKPYTIRWYSDYELTHLLKEETMTATGPDTSFYDTLALTHHAEVFVAIQKDGVCPTVYGLPNNNVNMTTGNTEIPCGKIYRLYDDGGPDGNYSTGTSVRHTYTTEDGKPVTIHFEELNLSETAHLFVITGTTLSADSLLYDLTAGSDLPGVISSHGNALTLYFIPGMKSAAGWSAIVEHSPGMSIADVWNKSETVLRDEVCQSQTNTYDDIYGVVPNIVPTLDTLNQNIRKAGLYIYSDTIKEADVHGCDSIVTFMLTVNPPVMHDTTVVITNQIGSYYWPLKDTTLTTTGRYVKRTSMSNGCDSLDVLDLIIIQVDTIGDDVCIGENGTVGILASAPDMTSFSDDLIPAAIKVGDVLCTDGSILDVDDYLASDKTAMGIVFYVDNTGSHGRAAALKNAGAGLWAAPLNNSYVNYQVRSYTNAKDITEARRDTCGYQNTLSIKEYAETLGDFATYAPSAYKCYYWDHRTGTQGPTHLGWYMPAIGEISLLYANQLYVNQSLSKLGLETISNTNYWGSTGHYRNATTNYDCSYHISKAGEINTGGTCSYQNRAIIRF